MADGEKIKVLFVDDEVHNLEAFKASFRRDFQVYVSLNANDAMKLLETEPIQIVLSDQRMPGITGVEFFEHIQQNKPEIMRMLITGYADINIVVDAVNKGKIFKYIQKPWNNEQLKESILQAYKVYTEQEQRKKDIDDLKVLNEQLEFLARQNLLS
jgi:response regulator RpfG family c-di-GMP phosphodiesterase